MTESKIDKVLANRVGKFRRGFHAQFAQRLTGAIYLCANFFDFFGKSLQFRVAPFDLLHPLGGASTELDHFRDRAAVFTLQCFEKRNPLLERGQLFGIEIEFLGVIGKGARNFGQLHDRGRMFGSKLLRGDVDLFEFAQQALRFCELRYH